MIFDAIVNLLMNVLTGVLGLFPSYSPSFSGFGSNVGAALAGANTVFPVVTLGTCIMAVIGLRVFLAVVTFIAWVWDKVPFTFK